MVSLDSGLKTRRNDLLRSSTVAIGHSNVRAWS
jgi:hypothetical protein